MEHPPALTTPAAATGERRVAKRLSLCHRDEVFLPVAPHHEEYRPSGVALWSARVTWLTLATG